MCTGECFLFFNPPASSFTNIIPAALPARERRLLSHISSAGAAALPHALLVIRKETDTRSDRPAFISEKARSCF